jgi:hypothetical protein
MPKTFRVYVDSGGNMPQLRHTKWQCKSHPYYIQYINDCPVSYYGPRNIVAGNVTRDSVWCYLTSGFVSIDNLTALSN